MDTLLRTVAIIVEVTILGVIISSLLFGVRLIIFDLGIGPKYKKIVTMALVLAGTISIFFFIAAGSEQAKAPFIFSCRCDFESSA